jgi:hypothetical protein
MDDVDVSFVDPPAPLSEPVADNAEEDAEEDSSVPVMVSKIRNNAFSAVVTVLLVVPIDEESAFPSSPLALADASSPSSSSSSANSSPPLATRITRSSEPGVGGATLTRAPVSSRIALMTRPSFPMTLPMRVVGHNNLNLVVVVVVVVVVELKAIVAELTVDDRIVPLPSPPTRLIQTPPSSPPVVVVVVVLVGCSSSSNKNSVARRSMSKS